MSVTGCLRTVHLLIYVFVSFMTEPSECEGVDHSYTDLVLRVRRRDSDKGKRLPTPPSLFTTSM